MLEVLLVVLLVLAFFLIAYKGAVHEFQILQKDWSTDIPWSNLLSEQLPIVVRNVDPAWQGGWTRRATQHKTWPIRVLTEDGPRKGKWNEWLASPPGQPVIDPRSMSDIQAFVKAPVVSWSDGGFHRWNWLPVQSSAEENHVLGPSATSILPVRKTVAAATTIQATDGAPLQLWIAHEGAVPASVSQTLVGEDPWASQDIPWMNEVKFIEMKLRPGNALVLPAHWYFAARPLLPVVSDQPIMADGAWFWIAEFHTPISWLVSCLAKK